MSYKNQLFPWCIIRPFPNMRSTIVGRFRRRVEAEGHLRILKQLIPDVPYIIAFDITPENLTSLPDKDSDELEADSPLLVQKRLTERSIEE
jgi:hypothetical protein